jgi:hypothetical protein
VLLKRSKALVTFRQQGDTALKFRRIKEAGPGCCFANMECQRRAGPGCSLSRCSGSGLCAGLGRLDLESTGLGRGSGFVWDRGLGRGSRLGRGRSLLGRWSLGRWLFRRGRCSLSSRGRFRDSPDFWYCRALSFVIYAGALVACAGIFSSPGAAGGRASVRGIWLGSCVHVDIRSRWILLSPRVHVDVGGRVVLLRRRIVLHRGGGFVGRRRRCRRRRSGMTCRGYVGGGSGHRLFNVGAGT